MFKFLKSIITKMVSWSIRKLGGGFKEIGKKLLDYSIDISEKPIQDKVITSIDEIDMFGQYDNINRFQPIPLEKIVETTDNLARNYLTKLEVYYRVPGVSQPFAEYISMLHDKNLSPHELELQATEILDRYAVEMGAKQADIVQINIAVVLHKSGNPY